MVISSITLKNFRNHSYLTFDFSSKINILTGINGVGKTNVVEAIYYLSLARSFRVNDNNELIKKGKDASQIIAKIKEGDITRTIDITLTPDGRRILVNGKPINKLSQLVKITNIILFEPKDVLLFRGPPKERRNFLDISLSKKSEAYLDYISRYDKLLKQRNDILKSNKLDKLLLDATTEMLIKLEGPIVSYRQMYVKDINDILNTITRTLTGTHAHVTLVYTPFVKYNNLQQFEEEAKRLIQTKLKTKLNQKPL